MRRTQRPGVLAIRALNQYRQRDVMTYLGLRYYLDNEASRTDHWAETVATDLVCRRAAPSYFKSLHYKDHNEEGVVHREMYFPGANEALAESALINACSNASGDGFAISDDVYSYRPVAHNDQSGIFEHYMLGLQRRHNALSAACHRENDAHVVFMDIKKFYPSISCRAALGAWRTACSRSNLTDSMRVLGECLISDYGTQSADSAGNLLTGPMFSHLLANLVMAPVDRKMAESGVRYFRYVDDIALVGSKDRVRKASLRLRVFLEEMGLAMHDEFSEKTLHIEASDWLEGEDDFYSPPSADSWMRLVGDIKTFLVASPPSSNDLSLRFASHGFRLPVPDYSAAASEISYAKRVGKLVRKPRMFLMSPAKAVDELANRAEALKTRYHSEFVALAEDYEKAQGYKAKRLVPKIRYRMGRLAYLSPMDELGGVASSVKWPALMLQSEVVKAIASRDVNKVIEMGGNAAQAVAQPLSVEGNSVRITKRELSVAEMQSVAIFKFNGIQVDVPAGSAADSELVRFAENGADIFLMKSKDAYISSLACLHGLASEPRHAEMLDSPFDPEEEVAHDTIDFIVNSMSN